MIRTIAEYVLLVWCGAGLLAIGIIAPNIVRQLEHDEPMRTQYFVEATGRTPSAFTHAVVMIVAVTRFAIVGMWRGPFMLIPVLMAWRRGRLR